ncbi:MAG: hypothetical protein HRT89_03435 [Lentisphaeria bacterium]|nr:hypothetical protein [Lentisphaeria bacterium]
MADVFRTQDVKIDETQLIEAIDHKNTQLTHAFPEFILDSEEIPAIRNFLITKKLGRGCQGVGRSDELSIFKQQYPPHNQR